MNRTANRTSNREPSTTPTMLSEDMQGLGISVIDLPTDFVNKVKLHPIVDYTSILVEIFESEKEFKKVSRLDGMELHKFLRCAQQQCRLPMIPSHTLHFLHHYLRSLQHYTASPLPLEASPVELTNVLLAPSAHGGMASVWKGTWLSNQTVAVKRLKAGHEHDQLKGLRKELGVLRQLKHPHVIRVLGYSWESDLEDEKERRPFIIMPWMANGAAYAYLKANPLANRVKIIDEVSSGLSYLHKAGIVHGDLKGDNVLLDEKMTAYITDFGNCVVVEDVLSLEPAGSTFVGTVRWTAPERLEGGPSTERTDVFAWAMLALELITDLPPFSPKISSELMVSKALRKGDRPSRPSKTSSRGLDDRLWALIKRAWSHDPKARPKSDVLREEMRPISKDWGKAMDMSGRIGAMITARNGGAMRSLVPIPGMTSGTTSKGSKGRSDLHSNSRNSQTSSQLSSSGSIETTNSPMTPGSMHGQMPMMVFRGGEKVPGRR